MIAPSHSHAPIERLPKAVEESDLIEEYSRVVKEGREKLGISQQDLAFKAKEKLTVIQKIEIGKMGFTSACGHTGRCGFGEAQGESRRVMSIDPF
jgi:ribosome-binding protein aMBF1 (putative translation factor)